MGERYFSNPYQDYSNEVEVFVNHSHIRSLIQALVQQILKNTTRGDSRGDLYVGDAGWWCWCQIPSVQIHLMNSILILGIAFMFLRLWQTGELVKETSAIDNAQLYIARAKRNAKQYSRSRDERCAFLCGNAGIYAVSAVISQLANKNAELQQDLHEFATGFEACKPINFNKYGSDELLVGRAGYLSGVYWLNKNIKPAPFEGQQILEVCQSIVESGRQYSQARRSAFPLMYQYHGTEYLGAAHGLCSILHMLLESPWFQRNENDGSFANVPKDYLADIKNSIDAFVGKYGVFSIFCTSTSF